MLAIHQRLGSATSAGIGEARFPFFLINTHSARKFQPTMKPLMTMAAALVALPAVGCGEQSYEPKLVPVSGTVTFNGKPLEGATIVFVPTQGNKDQTSASDITGVECNYKAMTGGRSGVAPGRYKVIVEKPDVSGSMPEGIHDDPYMASIIAKARDRKSKGAGGKRALPSRSRPRPSIAKCQRREG